MPSLTCVSGVERRKGRSSIVSGNAIKFNNSGGRSNKLQRLNLNCLSSVYILIDITCLKNNHCPGFVFTAYKKSHSTLVEEYQETKLINWIKETSKTVPLEKITDIIKGKLSLFQNIWAPFMVWLFEAVWGWMKRSYQ